MSLSRLGPRVDHEGERAETPVIDDNSVSLLSRILKQLKILNLHQMIQSDVKFDEKDVE